MEMKNRSLTALSLALLLSLSVALSGQAGAAPRAPSGFLNVMPQEAVGEADLARMADGNVRGVRYSISWAQVQPTDGRSFDWGYFDYLFREAARKGIRILPSLYYTPSWVSSKPTDLPVGSTRQLKAWKSFVLAAVERYGSQGTFWEENGPSSSDPVRRMPVRQWMIWNEPNFFYFASPVSPRNYGRLLNASSAVIKRSDPAAKVMVGGLFARPAGAPKRALSAAKFISQMMATAKKSSFDQVALHPYTPGINQLKLVLEEFRGALIRKGLGSRKVVVSEIGWGSGPRTNAFLTGSEEAQAQILTKAFNLLIRNRSKFKIQSVYWYSWKDLPPGSSCNFCSSVGLFEEGDFLNPKPAWQSFVRFTGGRF